MSIFQQFKEHVNKHEVGQEFDVNEFTNKIVGSHRYDFSYNVLNIYLWAFAKAGVLEEIDTKNAYIIKQKIPKNLSLVDFLEKTKGDNWKEWFIQVGE